jgi:sialidase-1
MVFTRILWDKTNTSHNNYRIPSLIVTKENTLLAFAEGRESGDTGDIDMLLRRSTDNGKTWEDQIIVWDDRENTCGNPCPVVDHATGRIFLFMTWNLGDDREYDIIRKKSKNTRVPYMTYSDDDGLTWSEPQSLMDTSKKPEWGWYATGPGVGIQMTSKNYKDRLIIPCNNSFNDPENMNRDGFGFGAHVLISDDHGESWRMSELIAPEVNESQVVELEDGKLVMNMRSYNGKQSRAIAYSNDGGETWSEVMNDSQLVEPICQASFSKYGNYKGKIMYLFSNPATPTNRTNMTIKLSFDETETWSNSKLIYSGPSAYSNLARLPNGNIGLFFEMGKNNPYEKMMFVSISPDELFQKEAIIKQGVEIN